MNRRYVLIISSLVFLMCLRAQCTPPQPGENLLAPRQWMQLQSDEQGSGFNGVHSTFAVPSNRKWQVNIGDMAFSSPVIDIQGNIWVGNVAGELVGIRPNGTEKTRVNVGGSIVSSPAVDVDGRVFVLAQYQEGDSFRTILREYDPAVGFAPVDNPPQYKSTASPKIWDRYVFVPADTTLRVYDRWTLGLVDEHSACSNLACGFFEPPLWVQAIGNFVGCFGTLYTTELLGLIDCFGFSIGASPGLIIEPSVAIVDNANIVDDIRKPIIVLATPRCLTAFNFDPTGSPKLKVRWSQEMAEDDCDFEVPRLTTPAILDAEQVVIGTDNGVVVSYHIDDGRILWNHSTSLSLDNPESIQAPPVAGIRQIYVVTTHYLVVLDSNGEETARITLDGIGGGVSQSLDFVYVMTSKGIYSVRLNPDGTIDLQTFDRADLDASHVGSSVPAIDRDGNIFLSTPNGSLFAYGQGPLFIAALRAPQISWISPVEGELINYSPGRTLNVSLDDETGFTGEVVINSNVDGELCRFHADAANEGSCITENPLTLGTHVLTVFVTDENGVQQSASINVQVVNNALTVQITAPEDGATLFSTIPINLTAQTFVPDETIPDEHINWKSDVQGDLGIGHSLDVLLSNGTHVITCTATDSASAEASDSIIITVIAPIG
jgi:outer membrane protein assembly factor BamB